MNPEWCFWSRSDTVPLQTKCFARLCSATCHQASVPPVDPSPLPLWLYPLLFLTGLAAGFVDSIVGGGGLISLPVLLSVGMPPQLALGTNKLQATFGSGSATWHYARAGLIDFNDCKSGVL